MEQNEIRVGNWLNDPRPFNEDTKKFFKMTDNGYFKAKARDIEVAELFEPITLTKEILLNCGFKILMGYMYETNNLQGKIRMNENNEFMYEYNSIVKKINGVHQLQNLYFALTGKDLEINL